MISDDKAVDDLSDDTHNSWSVDNEETHDKRYTFYELRAFAHACVRASSQFHGSKPNKQSPEIRNPPQIRLARSHARARV